MGDQTDIFFVLPSAELKGMSSITQDPQFAADFAEMWIERLTLNLVLLPEQMTEAVFPWVQSGMPRAVTGQFHKKDSTPEQ